MRHQRTLAFWVVDNIASELLGHSSNIDTIVTNLSVPSFITVCMATKSLQKRGTSSTWSSKHQQHLTLLDETRDTMKNGLLWLLHFVEQSLDRSEGSGECSTNCSLISRRRSCRLYNNV